MSIAALISCLSEEDNDVQAFFTAREGGPETSEFKPASASREQGSVETEDQEPTDDDQWGPKTTEMPDPQFYASKDMEDLLDVGSLPDHLKEKAWV